MGSIYLDDYSQEDLIHKDLIHKDLIYNNKSTNENKANIELQPDYNRKGEKVAVFRLTLPVRNNALTIDILINDELYKKIGEQFNK